MVSRRWERAPVTVVPGFFGRDIVRKVPVLKYFANNNGPPPHQGYKILYENSFPCRLGGKETLQIYY